MIFETSLLISSKLLLAALQIFPSVEGLIWDVERLGNIAFWNEDITEGLPGPVVVFRYVARGYGTLLHDAGSQEWRARVAHAEGFGHVVGIVPDSEDAYILRGAYRKGAGHDPRRKALVEIPFRVGKSAVDVDALAPLGEAVFRTVYDTPLHRIARTYEAREDNREIAAALGGGTLKQAVDVF